MMKPLTTLEIDEIMMHHPNYLGCYAADEIPRRLKRPCTIIVNTDPIGQPGTHWIGLLLKKNKAFYFDSFGLPLIQIDILNYLKKYYKYVIYNKKCIQHVNSLTCGLYCIAFAQNVNNEKMYRKFLNSFSSNHPKVNDNIVIQFISK